MKLTGRQILWSEPEISLLTDQQVLGFFNKFWVLAHSKCGYKNARASYNLETQLIEKVVEFLQSEGRDEESAVLGHAVENEASFGGGRRRKKDSKSLGLRDEVKELVEASEAGVAYILGNTYIIANEASAIMKKFAINSVYGFLRRNSRRPAIALGIPHSSLIELGMAYHV